MVIIEENKRVDWNAIRAEYIGGGTSYRKLAEKYGVSFMVLKTKAKKENWTELRTQAEHKATTEATQKTAEAAAENALLASELKKRLLMRLKRTEEKFPLDATEVRTRQGNSIAIYRLKDLTSAYKDLTEDIQMGETGEQVRVIIDV